jgi:hypothetical protein
MHKAVGVVLEKAAAICEVLGFDPAVSFGRPLKSLRARGVENADPHAEPVAWFSTEMLVSALAMWHDSRRKAVDKARIHTVSTLFFERTVALADAAAIDFWSPAEADRRQCRAEPVLNDVCLCMKQTLSDNLRPCKAGVHAHTYTFHVLCHFLAARRCPAILAWAKTLVGKVVSSIEGLAGAKFVVAARGGSMPVWLIRSSSWAGLGLLLLRDDIPVPFPKAPAGDGDLRGGLGSSLGKTGPKPLQ